MASIFLIEHWYFKRSKGLSKILIESENSVIEDDKIHNIIQQELQRIINNLSLTCLGNIFQKVSELDPMTDYLAIGILSELTNRSLPIKYNLLVGRNPELIKEWNFETNTHVSLFEITFGSQVRANWTCLNHINTCGRVHTWEISICERTSNHSGCKKCALTGISVCPCSTFAALRPDLVALWHPTLNKTENYDLKPDQFRLHSGQRIWWLCTNENACKFNCEHAWESRIADIVDGHGCPFCSNNRICCEGKSLAELYPEVAAQWDHEKNDGLKPTQVSCHSHRLIWWRCNNVFDCECPHLWRASIGARTGSNHTKCPWCLTTGGLKKVCEHHSLAGKRLDLMKEWDHDKNKQDNVEPENCSLGSNIKVWWKCSLSHSWKAMIYDRTRVDGSGCPDCSRFKQEKECREILEKRIGLPFPKIRHGQIRNPITDRSLELDCYNSRENLALEFQGEQHYNYSDFFHRGDPENLKRQQERDEIKRSECERLKIKLIVVPYTCNTYEKKYDFIMTTLKSFGY